MRTRVLDDDGGRRFGKTGEKIEKAGAGFLGVGVGFVERKAQVDDGDVDGGGAEDFGGFATGVGSKRTNAHGLEQTGEAVGPGVALPTGVGEEEVEAATGRTGSVRREPIRWEVVAARNLHHARSRATGMPENGGWLAW